MKICHVESKLLAAAHVKELMFQNHLASAKRNSERKDYHLFFIFYLNNSYNSLDKYIYIQY